jgi:hypothetical protein
MSSTIPLFIRIFIGFLFKRLKKACLKDSDMIPTFGNYFDCLKGLIIFIVEEW